MIDHRENIVWFYHLWTAKILLLSPLQMSMHLSNINFTYLETYPFYYELFQGEDIDHQSGVPYCQIPLGFYRFSVDNVRNRTLLQQILFHLERIACTIISPCEKNLVEIHQLHLN